ALVSADGDSWFAR
nr:RecName: Full=Uncharacterized protein IMPP13 [Nautilus macromphalus]